jgi:hypothetical protein
MAIYYFRNTGSTSFNTTTNWSTTDGGGSAGIVPGSSDTATFTSNSGSCSLDVASKILTGLNFVNSSYIHTFTFTNSLTVSGNVTFASGMTIAGSGGLTLTGAASTIAGNGVKCPIVFTTAVSLTLDFGNGFISGLTLTSISKTISLASSIRISVILATSGISTAHNIINSTVGGTKRTLINYTQDLSFVDFTDIDGTSGPIIRTYKGTITNSTGVVLLVAPTIKGTIFII